MFTGMEEQWVVLMTGFALAILGILTAAKGPRWRQAYRIRYLVPIGNF
jgi:hypothetical protein